MRANPRMDWLRDVALLWRSDACLLWPFATDRDGYGRVKDGGYETRSHRMIFFLANGRWPTPCALHSCDTPGCCNLRHISEGTNQQNQKEKVERGRSLRGVQQYSAKLNDELVRQIRREYQPRVYGKGSHCLARKYGVTKPIIRGILSGRLWRHVA